MKENVRHKTFNFCLAQFPERFFLATRAILYPTTEKNHPVMQLYRDAVYLYPTSDCEKNKNTPLP